VLLDGPRQNVGFCASVLVSRCRACYIVQKQTLMAWTSVCYSLFTCLHAEIHHTVDCLTVSLFSININAIQTHSKHRNTDVELKPHSTNYGFNI